MFPRLKKAAKARLDEITKYGRVAAKWPHPEKRRKVFGHDRTKIDLDLTAA